MSPKSLADGLYLLSQIALIGNALKGYPQAEVTKGKPAPSVTAEPLQTGQTDNTPAAPVNAKPFDRRWLWAVRIAALLGPGVISLFILNGDLTSPGGRFTHSPLGKLPIWPLMVAVCLPYIHIILRLADRPYKKGLASGVTWGSTAFLISTTFFALAFVAAEESMMLFAGLFMFSQALLVPFAIRAYYLVEPEAGDTGTLMMSLIPTAVYLAVWSAVFLVAWFTLNPIQG